MRIEKIFLENYYGIRNKEILFNQKDGNDFHVVVLEDNSNYNTLMNAFYSCLFGKDYLPYRYLSKSEGDQKVQLLINLDINNKFLITRKKNNDENSIQITSYNSQGIPKILTKEDSDLFLKDFLTNYYSELFFLDEDTLNKFSQKNYSKEVLMYLKDKVKLDNKELNMAIEQKSNSYLSMFPHKMEKIGKIKIGNIDNLSIEDRFSSSDSFSTLSEDDKNAVILSFVLAVLELLDDKQFLIISTQNCLTRPFGNEIFKFIEIMKTRPSRNQIIYLPAAMELLDLKRI